MKIIVLCGGSSTEREVSLRSGDAVLKCLRESGRDADLLDVKSISELTQKWKSTGGDVAFVAMHGGWGEDGRLQAVLDAMGVPYTGSGPAACRAAMDKELSREVMRSAGVPIPDGVAILPGDERRARDSVAEWGKVVVKPASGGSTVGVTITDDSAAAERALSEIWDIDTKAIVERFIPGRELTATVFGEGDGAFAMPIIEIRPASGFYDYRSKYTAGASEYLCPAPLADDVRGKIADLALKTYRAHDCRTYARIDFRLTEENDARALEVNTAPGMTATSLVPKAAAACGWSFAQLLARIIDDIKQK